MARITGIKYDRNELLDIMDQVSMSIRWAVVTETVDAEDGRVKMLTLTGEGINIERLVLNDLQRAIDEIVGGSVQINSEVRNWIASGDVGMIDAEAADCIAQVACFGELVYA